MDCAKTAARRDEKHLCLGIGWVLYYLSEKAPSKYRLPSVTWVLFAVSRPGSMSPCRAGVLRQSTAWGNFGALHNQQMVPDTTQVYHAGLILGLRPANAIRRYCVTFLIGWAQAKNQPCHRTCCLAGITKTSILLPSLPCQLDLIYLKIGYP